MLNFRKLFLLIFVYSSLKSVTNSQNIIPVDTSNGYSFQVNKFEMGLMGKPLNIIDTMLMKLNPNLIDIAWYDDFKFKTNEKLDKIEKRNRYKIMSRFDSSGFLLKKKFKKKCIAKNVVGEILPLQMLSFGNGFYLQYAWENKEIKSKKFMGVDAPVLSNVASLDVLIIEDTTLNLLFFFSDIDDPEYQKIDFFPSKKPQLTFANYQSIAIFNTELMPIGLVTRAKNFKDAYIVILNSQGFFDSTIRLSWEDLRKHTLAELVAMLQKAPHATNNLKIYDKKLYTEHWSVWGSTIRYNWKF